MEISSSVSSASPSAKTGCGADALFEEIAPSGSDDIDPTEADAAGGFAAMIQAALAAATPLAPIPTVVAVVSGRDSADADSAVNATGDSVIAGETKAQFAQTLPATDAMVSATEADGDAAASAVRQTEFVDQQDAVDALVAREEEAASQAVPSEETDGQSTDNVMLAVEQAMESFTPMPASVLALMRAGSADQDLTAAAGPSRQRPLAAGSGPNDVDAADSELFGASGDVSISLMPAIDFATSRAAETDSFADVVGAVRDRSGDSLPDHSGAPDLSASQMQPGASLPGSTPLGGRDHAPAVQATREAIGAFAIDQIITRSSGSVDEPVSRIEARIDPPELGRISIEISRSPEGLTAHLTVEDASVLALLDQQMKEVRQTLDAAGVPMASLTMSMGSGDDAPRQQSQRDDEALSLATPARTGRSAGIRPTGATRREIDTTA